MCPAARPAAACGLGHGEPSAKRRQTSRSIRHGHVSVKDTRASLARAALSRDTGGEPRRLGGRWRGQRAPCLGGRTRGTLVRTPVAAHHRRGPWACPPPRGLGVPWPVLTAPHAARLLADARAKVSRVGTPAHAPSAPRVFGRHRSAHDMEHTTTDGPATVSLCDDHHVPWSPAQPLVMVHCLGGGHRERRRGAFPGQEA
jgi:hypothetical protein